MKSQVKPQYKTKGVRPVVLHVSDRVTNGFRHASLPKELIQSTPHGVVAQTKTPTRGDYQCNLPMSLHSRYIRPLKTKSQLPSVTTDLNSSIATTTGEKKSKKDKAPPPINKVFAIPAQPHRFNPQDVSTLPDTAHDLAYQSLSSIISTNNNEIINPNGNDPKKSSDFFSVDDTMFHGVSVAPQGFLGLRLTNKYIGKRLLPFLTQNDAPPPLLFESDMKYLTPTGSDISYDDRPLSLVPPSKEITENQSKDGFAPKNVKSMKKKATPLPAYPRVVTIDYSSPNIAKEMHVGHIRSTCIGDSLARVLEFSGNTVQRINHLGDWGTQFGMLLCHFNDLLKKGANLEDVDIGDLQSFYQTAKKRFDDEPDFQINAKDYVVRLQSGDPECRHIWQQFCGLSRPSVQRVFSRLQIDPRLLERGESFYQPFLPDVIEELLISGVAIERDGVVLLPPQNWFEEQNNPTLDTLEGGEPQPAKKVNKGKPKEDKIKSPTTSTPANEANREHAEGHDEGQGEDDEEDETSTTIIPDAVVLRKSDGGFTYGATDMASIRLRLLGKDCWYKASNQPNTFFDNAQYQNELGAILPADWALYVVDSGQSSHFARVFESAKRVGWVDRAQNIAQQRKVQYFHDILDTLANEGISQVDSSVQHSKEQNKAYKIVRSALDGDMVDFHQQSDSPVINTDTDLLERPDLRIQHVNFGVVCGPDGKRLRTRAGKSIKLVELLDESVSRSKAIIEEMNKKTNELDVNKDVGEDIESNSTPQLTRKELRQQILRRPDIQQQLAESIGYASIKYADLSKNRIGDYVFDFDKMLDLQGNTAGYLLYAHARLFSLLQRCVEAEKYNPIVNHLLTMHDPFEKYEKMIDYDYQFLATPQHSNSHFDSTFDLMAQNPNLISDILKSLNKDDKDIENQHDVLVSAAIAQYASKHALDTNSISYPRRKPFNDDIWNNVPTSSTLRASSEYLSSISHNVSTLDSTYGVSLTPVNKPFDQDIYNTLPIIALDHSSERGLGLHIAQFHDAISSTLYGLTPNNMADYSMGLSHAFTSFYRDCSVVPKSNLDTPTTPGTSDQFSTSNSRVLLTHTATVTLQRSLDLVGIQPTKFM